MRRSLLTILFCLLCSIPCTTNAFVFWLKSSDNTVANIVEIEKTYNLYLPLVGFIYDPWDQQDVIWELKNMKELLWDKRIYHITVSPNSYNADQVAAGAFDKEYESFFKTIKELKLKVIFRTMHEMNGGWYPRGSNPESFKKAWIHVRELAHSLWLTQNDILFDFSVNHRDMPTNWTPSQSATLIECKPKEPIEKQIKALEKKKSLTKEEKEKLTKKKNELKKLEKCYRFEDYFPWNDYVDVVWVTFYNWWKATSWRQRKTPSQILNDSSWNTVQRLKNLWEPLIIDEVWTTAVWYSDSYSRTKSKKEFLSTWADERKNIWLGQLWDFLQKNNFLGAVYFNVDYTHWLDYPSVWEADRAIINLELNKYYQWFLDLYASAIADYSNLLSLFWLSSIKINTTEYYVPFYTTRNIKFIEDVVNNHFSWDMVWISDFYKRLLETPTGQKSFDEAVKVLAEEYILLSWSEIKEIWTWEIITWDLLTWECLTWKNLTGEYIE